MVDKGWVSKETIKNSSIRLTTQNQLVWTLATAECRLTRRRSQSSP